MDTLFQEEVSIPVSKITLKDELFIPMKSKAIFIFSLGYLHEKISEHCCLIY